MSEQMHSVLDELKSARTVVGMKQLRRAVSSGNVRKVFLADDADPRLTQPLKELCADLDVDCIAVSSMKELGRACGIEVGASAAGIFR